MHLAALGNQYSRSLLYQVFVICPIGIIWPDVLLKVARFPSVLGSQQCNIL